MRLSKTITLVLVLIIVFCYSEISSQDVIASSGDQYELNGLSLEWTLGESFITDYNIDGLVFEEGFHNNSSLEQSSTSIFNIVSAQNLKVFPNPTAGIVNIEEIGNVKWKYIFLLTAEAKIISHLNISENKINLDNFPSGNYYLVLLDKENQNYIAKILKL